ncbi:MAG: NAD(+) synthase, partial [Alistipes sp.]|nr:NAD(+) synthase [Alistipes sp.]
MNNFGFIKVAAAIPSVRVADCDHNSEQIISLMQQASARGVRVVTFPEMSLTAYTCGDLLQQPLLHKAAEKALKRIIIASLDLNIVAIVGLPVVVDDKLYNCAAVVADGKLMGIVPKQHIPAMESRWFSSGANIEGRVIEEFAGQSVYFGWDQLFDVDGVKFGVEIGDDIHAPIAPSTIAVKNGAKLIFNPSATIEIAGKHDALAAEVTAHLARLAAAYVYSAAGFGESTTDYVYAGDAFIAECGSMLGSAERYSLDEQLIVADVDIEAINYQRQKQNGVLAYSADEFMVNEITLCEDGEDYTLDRTIDPMPFVPKNITKRSRLCEEVFAIQTLGLVKRLKHTSCRSAVIGISGGLDSTLALLVAVNAFDRLGLDRTGIIGVTMPGFGTTDRTYNNAVTLIKELGITFKEISIAAACRQHFADIGLPEGDHSVTFENAQARERTQILMDVANMTGGMVIGTGDMSELALGWATYNGDQMSMYGVNCNVAKTLVRHIVLWAADNEGNAAVRNALKDVVATPVSPELLPAQESGEIAQKTEDLVGPYELHDFFLYNFLRNGFSPAKILFLAECAFDNYDRAT